MNRTKTIYFGKFKIVARWKISSINAELSFTLNVTFQGKTRTQILWYIGIIFVVGNYGIIPRKCFEIILATLVIWIWM